MLDDGDGKSLDMGAGVSINHDSTPNPTHNSNLRSSWIRGRAPKAPISRSVIGSVLSRLSPLIYF